MSYSTQCTQIVFGAWGSGASGSSTMIAKLLVPAGAPLHSRGGARSLPSQVYSSGMSPFGANAGDVSESVMGLLESAWMWWHPGTLSITRLPVTAAVLVAGPQACRGTRPYPGPARQLRPRPA
jgi:hypothetical protein